MDKYTFKLKTGKVEVTKEFSSPEEEIASLKEDLKKLKDELQEAKFINERRIEEIDRWHTDFLEADAEAGTLNLKYNQAEEGRKKAEHERDVYKELLSGSSADKKFTSRQIAIIAYALCRKGGFVPKNKKSIASLFHDMTGFSSNTISQNLCSSYTDEEVEEVAHAVEKYLPKFAEYLRENTFSLPERTK